MERPTADILYSDEVITIVLCPYCKGKHKHGDLWGANDARQSHCKQGEYLLGNPITDAYLFQAIKEKRDMSERKRRHYQATKASRNSAPGVS